MTTKDSTTVEDCHFNGTAIRLTDWPSLPSSILAMIVGEQSPGGALESACEYTWAFTTLDVETLRHATEDGDEPEGGWIEAYTRHCASDEEAIRHGSEEYAGRAHWLKHVWAKNTHVYPLYIVQEHNDYRIWDGYHRLAGAFYVGLQRVSVLLGTPK